MKIDAAQVERLAKEFEGKTAQEVLRWALDSFGARIGLASSFGAEDVAIIDMMAGISKEKTNVFTAGLARS